MALRQMDIHMQKNEVGPPPDIIYHNSLKHEPTLAESM